MWQWPWSTGTLEASRDSITIAPSDMVGLWGTGGILIWNNDGAFSSTAQDG
jgi:hypothetical protein